MEASAQGGSDPQERRRHASVSRETSETRVMVSLAVDGGGRARIETGVGFFDHLLSALARHGFLDLELAATGDLEVEAHHLVEDVGLTLGKALAQAVAGKAGLARFGSAVVPMDDALVMAALDYSGRPYLRWDFPLEPRQYGGFHTDLAPEFFRALTAEAGFTLHVRLLDGTNAHHCLEAAFKAVGRALAQAIGFDDRVKGVHSTKGTL